MIYFQVSDTDIQIYIRSCWTPDGWIWHIWTMFSRTASDSNHTTHRFQKVNVDMFLVFSNVFYIMRYRFSGRIRAHLKCSLSLVNNNCYCIYFPLRARIRIWITLVVTLLHNAQDTRFDKIKRRGSIEKMKISI